MTYQKRNGLSLLRERVHTGLTQGVVIRTLDRLSRSQIHLAIFTQELQKCGATLHCVQEAIDDTPMGKSIRMVLAFMAEMEREKQKEGC